METLKENPEVIDGIEFVETFDGKTCQFCTAYDGHICVERMPEKHVDLHFSRITDVQ